MKAKLKVIKNWEFEEVKPVDKSFKYSPFAGKEMIARGEHEIVLWTSVLDNENIGILWIKGDSLKQISSPESKEERDIWKNPILLSCDKGILLLCPATKKLWYLQDFDAEWTEFAMDNWCPYGTPMPITTTGYQGTFPIVCRLGNNLDSTNSFTILTVDFENKKAHWPKDTSCVYSKPGIREKHIASLERSGNDFVKADFNYQAPTIGSILEENGQFYAFLEGNITNPARLNLMGYYWFLEIEPNGLFKTKIWEKDNLSRLEGKHGMRGKFSGDRQWMILSPIFKNNEWKGKQKILRISDNELIDIVLPRGYASFRVIDIWGSHAFLTDENHKLTVCAIELA